MNKTRLNNIIYYVLLVGSVLMGYFAFTDLQISIAIVNRSSSWANFLERFGEIPGLLRAPRCQPTPSVGRLLRQLFFQSVGPRQIRTIADGHFGAASPHTERAQGNPPRGEETRGFSLSVALRGDVQPTLSSRSVRDYRCVPRPQPRRVRGPSGARDVARSLPSGTPVGFSESEHRDD